MSMRPLSHYLALYSTEENHGLVPSLLHKLLPRDAAAHCHGACVRGEYLVIFVESGVWATALQHRKQQLLDALRDECPTLRGLRLRVRPLDAKLPRPPRRRVSPEHCSELLAIASGVRDTALRRALCALAETLSH